jgi:hypothetical protein
MCTLHSFPHNIDHCLTYARSEFEGLLEKSPAEANAFLSDPAKYLSTVRQASDTAAHPVSATQLHYSHLSSVCAKHSCVSQTLQAMGSRVLLRQTTAGLAVSSCGWESLES